VFEKCAAQLGTMTHPTGNPPGLTADLLEILPGEVRHQVIPRQIAPKIFRRIEFRGVGGQIFHRQPGGLLPQIGLHVPPPMGRQPVPQEDRLTSSEMAFQCPQIVDDLGLFDRTGMKSQTESHSTTGRRRDQTGDRRQPLPVEGHHQNGWFSPWGPCPPHRRTFAKAAFVQENQQGPRGARFFLIRGQRYFSQRRTVVSSRSAARRSGRWQLHPNCLRSFQTWPG